MHGQPHVGLGERWLDEQFFPTRAPCHSSFAVPTVPGTAPTQPNSSFCPKTGAGLLQRRRSDLLEDQQLLKAAPGTSRLYQLCIHTPTRCLLLQLMMILPLQVADRI